MAEIINLETYRRAKELYDAISAETAAFLGRIATINQELSEVDGAQVRVGVDLEFAPTTNDGGAA